MAATVMPHARKPTLVDYRAMPRLGQALFDAVMARADVTGSKLAYRLLMAFAIRAIGIDAPGGDIVRCACPCYCGSIFDTALAGVRRVEDSRGYNLDRLQCPDCADQHPTPADH